MTCQGGAQPAGSGSREATSSGIKDRPGADLDAEAGEQAGRYPGMGPAMGLQHGAPLGTKVRARSGARTVALSPRAGNISGAEHLGLHTTKAKRSIPRSWGSQFALARH